MLRQYSLTRFDFTSSVVGFEQCSYLCISFHELAVLLCGLTTVFSTPCVLVCALPLFEVYLAVLSTYVLTTPWPLPIPSEAKSAMISQTYDQ